MNSKCILFYPECLLNSGPSFLIGHIQKRDSYFHVNCILAIEETHFTENAFNQLMLLNGPSGDILNGLSLLGCIGRNDLRNKYETYAIDSHIGFFIELNNSSLVQQMWFEGREVNPAHCVTVVLYNPEEVITYHQNNSHLISFKTFTSFIDSSCKQVSLLKANINKNELLDCIKYCLNEYKISKENEYESLWPSSSNLKSRPKMQTFCILMEKSQAYKSARRKLNTFHFILSDFSTNICLITKSKIMFFSTLVDVILGIIAMWSLSHPQIILDFGLYGVGMVVNNLKTLIQWLMGVPAGLKLNQPLNHALGHFFLYHIHLWQTYVSIILPIFTFIIKVFPFFGIFGFTFLMAVLQDLICLATLHIFCFYGYASKLYWCEMQGLASLWRLFRGRKWNQLRCRVDSYHYSQNQLLLGTFILSVLIFLLPTIVMYYSVFTSLRLVILAIQISLQKLSHYIGSFPFYIFWLHFLHKPGLPGELHFDIISKVPHQTIVLNLSVRPQSLLTSLQHFGSDKFLTMETTYLSWKTLFHNLIWGKLV